ncbi:MAG: PepSY-associated TM helix domain-containing protein [Steroidobacteraceae bacterium]
MRALHRWLMLVAVLPLFWLALTGTGIQLVDLRALLGDVPADNPNLESIREGIYGPMNFALLGAADYTSTALPADAQLQPLLDRALGVLRQSESGAALNWVELRMNGAQPRVIVSVDATRPRSLWVDPVAGTMMPAEVAPATGGGERSAHDQLKALHRAEFLGVYGVWLELIVALMLAALVFSGLWMYLRLYAARRRLGRSRPFWGQGRVPRNLHRWVALVACLLVGYVAITGTLLAIDNIAVSIFIGGRMPGPPGAAGSDPTFPANTTALAERDLPVMLGATLNALRSQDADAPIKALRLRMFGGMPQGVIVAGRSLLRQYVFDTRSGRRAGEYEKGYPVTGFPFGWGVHETVKQMHRGDIIGLPGRCLDLLTGLALLFLLITGTQMYLDSRRAAPHPR